jgi:hypothetical protein
VSSVFDYAETESNGKKQLVVRREAFEHACPFGGFKKRGQGEGVEISPESKILKAYSGASRRNYSSRGLFVPHFEQPIKSLGRQATGRFVVTRSGNRHFAPSIVETHFFKQRDEARLRAEWIKDPIHL